MRASSMRPIDSGFHRAFGNLQHGANLAVIESLQIAQNDRLAQFRRKPGKPALQLCAKLGCQREFVGRTRGRLPFLKLRHGVVN